MHPNSVSLKRCHYNAQYSLVEDIIPYICSTKWHAYMYIYIYKNHLHIKKERHSLNLYTCALHESMFSLY